MKHVVLTVSLCLTGCAETVEPGARFLAGVGPVSDFAMPITSVDQRKFSNVVRQRYDFSCGSAALATLLVFHYGEKLGEEDVFLGMWKDGDREAIRKVGFSLLDMKRYLEARKLRADGFKVSLSQIAETGIPGIALINIKAYKHFVVVKGVSDTEVLVGDPSTGLRGMSRTEFEAAWNGVYFVLNSSQDTGRAGFNRDAQWAGFSRAPIGARFADPLSLQALSLTAPFYRDF